MFYLNLNVEVLMYKYVFLITIMSGIAYLTYGKDFHSGIFQLILVIGFGIGFIVRALENIVSAIREG